MIFGLSGSEDDSGVIRSVHSARLSAASASRNDGVAFRLYQGLGIQVFAAPKVGRYQAQIAL